MSPRGGDGTADGQSLVPGSQGSCCHRQGYRWLLSSAFRYSGPAPSSPLREPVARPEQGGRVGELSERSRGAREGTRPPCTLAVRDPPPPRPLLLTGAGQTSPCFPTQGETFARKPEPDGRGSRSPRPVPAHGALGSAFGFLARGQTVAGDHCSWPTRSFLSREGPPPVAGAAALWAVAL